MGLSVFSMVKRWVFWSVRSGIQVDVEVNLRQRCDSHSCYQTTTQTCWRKDIMENLFKTKLVKQQKHPNFVCSQKKNVSFPLEPLLNLQNLAHVSHKYHMSLKQQGHPMGFQRPVERSPSFLMTQSESTRHTNDS